MLNHSLHQKLINYLLLIIVFTLPFYQQASIIAIIVLVIIWLWQKKFLTVAFTMKKNPFLLIWISYFILHLAGLLWTENFDYGWKDIQTKLSFLIFPLVMGTSSISSNLFQKIKRAFVAGCILASVYCVINAVINYLETNEQSVFFYTSFSALLHTTYFSIYLNLALLFLIEEAIHQWKNFNILNKIWEAAAISFLIVMIILLSARMAIAVCLITVLIYCISQVIKFQKGALILIISFAVMALINYRITHLYNRYTQVEEAARNYNNSPEADESPLSAQTYNSTTARAEFWKNAIEVIKQNRLLGVGTGDIKEELVKQYEQSNFQYGVENRFNPHNQYLHTGVILGITGIILLLCCLLLPLRLAVQQRNWLQACFLLIIILNAITESILERQNGIIFYAFFNVLLYMQRISCTDDSA